MLPDSIDYCFTRNLLKTIFYQDFIRHQGLYLDSLYADSVRYGSYLYHLVTKLRMEGWDSNPGPTW